MTAPSARPVLDVPVRGTGVRDRRDVIAQSVSESGNVVDWFDIVEPLTFVVFRYGITRGTHLRACGLITFYGLHLRRPVEYMGRIVRAFRVDRA